jgi:hypothetical protein
MLTACPSVEALAQMGVGFAADSCSPEVAGHIEACADCRNFLQRRVRNGLESFSGNAAAVGGSDELPVIDGFTIERELGRGAMGVVYLAHRDMPRRKVALKLLPGGRRASQRERRQWLRETEAASRVRHPNVVALYEVAEADNWFLLALEYIPGGTLADRLATPLAPALAAGLIETIARAVDHIHTCGQLHLDLKPSNILLDGDVDSGWEGVITKVSDFGISRLAEQEATETGGIGPGGTPSYMAPEQISRPRNEMTVATDIHGLGAILYHLLTGKPPYQGPTVLETIELVRSQEPVALRRLNPKIPRDLETICLKCLQKDPRKRYSSARALGDDLCRWREGRAISSRPVSAAEKGWRWCRRRPVVASLAAMLTLTFVVSFATVILLWRRAKAAQARAETAQARAEENFEISAIVVDSLLALRIGGDKNGVRVNALDDLIPRLARNSDLLLTLAASRTDEQWNNRKRTALESSLCEYLIVVQRYEEARNILLSALSRLDVAAKRYSNDAEISGFRSATFNRLAEVSEATNRRDESVGYRTQAIHWAEEKHRLAPDAGALESVFEMRRRLAWLLYRRGDREKARSLFITNVQQLGSRPSGFDEVNTAVERLKTDIELKICVKDAASRWPSETMSDKSANLAQLSALRSPIEASQTPEEWATVVAQILHCDRDGNAANASRLEAEDALKVTLYLGAIAKAIRRIDDIDGARQIARRLHALGRHMVATHPDQPAAYLVLSQAFAQLAKNASETRDDANYEANVQLSYGAADRALRLDPKSESVRKTVSAAKQKLDDLHPKR